MSTNNENPLDDLQELIPANTTSAPPGNIDDISKIKQNLSPGDIPESIVPPVLEEYLDRVFSPFVIYKGTWSTTQTSGTSLLSKNISPCVDYWGAKYVPYFVHELMKWGYYSGDFLLRMILFGCDAYRGSTRLKRTFGYTSSPATRVRAIEHRHVIDGGNLIHEHLLRFSSVGHGKLAYINEFTDVGVAPIQFQDVFYEKLDITVQTQLSVPSIYPNIIPFWITLTPLPNIQFLIRRNNLFNYLPSTIDPRTHKKQVVNSDNIRCWIEYEKDDYDKKQCTETEE